MGRPRSKHETIARRFARKFKTRHRPIGVDIRKGSYAIEVAASESDLYQSMRQLRASRKRHKYLAVPSELLGKAIEITRGTGIGVMGPTGKIHKRSRKKGA